MSSSFSTVTIPAGTTIIPVDTRRVQKVLYLPTVSTNIGRMLMIKDYYGSSSNSTITISTTGTDLLNDYNSRYTFSNAFGSMTFVSDGLRSWRLMGLYDGTYVTIPLFSIVTALPYQSNLLVDLRGTSYSSGGATWTNSVDNSTWSMTNTTYDAIYGGPLFNGSSTFAYRSSITNWNGLTFTIICYYYKNSTNTGDVILNANRTSANITNEAVFNENRYFDYSSVFGLDFGTTTTINTSGLVMNSFVKNNATGTLYRNNSANGTQTAATTVTVGNADFSIGKDYRDNISFLNGTIKRYIIYNIALNATDISNIYAILTS